MTPAPEPEQDAPAVGAGGAAHWLRHGLRPPPPNIELPELPPVVCPMGCARWRRPLQSSPVQFNPVQFNANASTSR
eukprot:1771470-Pyramimonas_sp.AAC.1